MQTQEYLRLITSIRGNSSVGPYKCAEDFVLRHGRSYTPARLPQRIRRMTIKQCFANCTRLALRHEDLTYVEGFALNIIPVHHAWCIDADGNVVDPTWEYGEHLEYFGVAFSTTYLRSVFSDERKKFYGLIDSPETDWPLLTGKHTDFAQAA